MFNENIKYISAYKINRPNTPIDLYLDGNEGIPPDLSGAFNTIMSNPDILCRYPDTSRLKYLLAEKLNVNSSNILVTAGGDEAIDRICRLTVAKGKDVILSTPTFPMFYHYIPLAGGEIKKVNWQGGDYPTDKVIEEIDDNTSLIVIVSPNNPTGLVASKDDITKIAKAASNNTILVDLVYTEFADEDLTQHALQYKNCVVVRSLSKACGLAGLRVGYAIGDTGFIQQLEKVGGPYPVSSLSCAMAIEALENDSGLYNNINSIKENRTKLINCLDKLSIETLDSQGNFVLAYSSNSKWIKDNLAGFGISIRSFEKDPDLKNSLRITIPTGDQIDRLINAIEAIVKPEAILFDMDGVLADVSISYRQAIIKTAKDFDVTVTDDDINRLKQIGNANKDWVVTHNLIQQKGNSVKFEDVKNRFERIYQGTNDITGLRYNESLIPSVQTLIDIKPRGLLP